MKGMVGELFHFSGFRTLTSLLPLVTSLLGLGLPICVIDSSPLLLHPVRVPARALVRLDHGIGREFLEALYDALRAFQINLRAQ